MVVIIFRPIFIFFLVGSLSLFFMQMFFIAGVMTTRIQRNVRIETEEVKHLKGYQMAAWGGLIAGFISLLALSFIGI